MQTVDLRDLVFENINEEYALGNYGGFKVIMMPKNGYINVTKLCKDGGKLFKNWKQNDLAEELINEVSSSAGIPANDLVITITGGKETLIRGTYAHPDLVPHIASWVSPKFAVKVSRIVNGFLVKQERDRQEAEKRTSLVKNNSLEEELRSFREEMRKRHEEYMHKLDNVKIDLKEVNYKLEDITDKLDDACERNYILEDKVDEALEETIIARQKVQELLPSLTKD